MLPTYAKEPDGSYITVVSDKTAQLRLAATRTEFKGLVDKVRDIHCPATLLDGTRTDIALHALRESFERRKGVSKVTADQLREIIPPRLIAEIEQAAIKAHERKLKDPVNCARACILKHIGVQRAHAFVKEAELPSCDRQKWNRECLRIDDYMWALLPYTPTPGGTGYCVDPLVLLPLMVCMHINAPSSPVAILPSGDSVPLLCRDADGTMAAYFCSRADGYASKSSIIQGVSGAFGCVNIGLEHTHNEPLFQIKYFQLAGIEGGKNYENNVGELNDKLLAVPCITFLVPYGDMEVYEMRISLTYGRDWALLRKETGTGTQSLRAHGEFCSWCPEHRNDVSRCFIWVQLPQTTTLADVARAYGISTKDLCRINPASDVPNQHGARGDQRTMVDIFSELDRNAPPVGANKLIFSSGPDCQRIPEDSQSLPAQAWLRVVNKNPTDREFQLGSMLHHRPLPEELEQAVLAEHPAHDSTLSAPILSLQLCKLHWGLRLVENLVERLVAGLTATQIDRINAIWKSMGIHAKVSKKEGSNQYEVHGVTGEAVDRISLLHEQWIPAGQSPLVLEVWATFTKINAMLHLPRPIPADGSTYVDIDQFEVMVYKLESLQTRLLLLWHICYDDSTYAAYLHSGAQHMALFYAFHLTLHSANQGVLEAAHVNTRHEQQNTFTKGAEETFRHSLRSVFFMVHESVPKPVDSICEAYADLCHEVRLAQKRITDCASNLRSAEKKGLAGLVASYEKQLAARKAELANKEELRDAARRDIEERRPWQAHLESASKITFQDQHHQLQDLVANCPEDLLSLQFPILNPDFMSVIMCPEYRAKMLSDLHISPPNTVKECLDMHRALCSVQQGLRRHLQDLVNSRSDAGNQPGNPALPAPGLLLLPGGDLAAAGTAPAGAAALAAAAVAAAAAAAAAAAPSLAAAAVAAAAAAAGAAAAASDAAYSDADDADDADDAGEPSSSSGSNNNSGSGGSSGNASVAAAAAASAAAAAADAAARDAHALAAATTDADDPASYTGMASIGSSSGAHDSNAAGSITRSSGQPFTLAPAQSDGSSVRLGQLSGSRGSIVGQVASVEGMMLLRQLHSRPHFSGTTPLPMPRLSYGATPTPSSSLNPSASLLTPIPLPGLITPVHTTRSDDGTAAWGQLRADRSMPPPPPRRQSDSQPPPVPQSSPPMQPPTEQQHPPQPPQQQPQQPQLPSLLLSGGLHPPLELQQQLPQPQPDLPHMAHPQQHVPVGMLIPHPLQPTATREALQNVTNTQLHLQQIARHAAMRNRVYDDDIGIKRKYCKHFSEAQMQNLQQLLGPDGSADGTAAAAQLHGLSTEDQWAALCTDRLPATGADASGGESDDEGGPADPPSVHAGRGGRGGRAARGGGAGRGRGGGRGESTAMGSSGRGRSKGKSGSTKRRRVEPDAPPRAWGR